MSGSASPGRLKELQPPPRDVPIEVKIKCLFGGFLPQFGWGFFSFGMLFMLIFGIVGEIPQGMAREAAFKGAHGKVQGVITAARETNASENETEIVYYQFDYQVNGTKYSGESYVTGWQYDVDQQATVEYLSSDPGLARLEQGRWSQFAPWVLLIIGIFPAVGLLMVGLSLPHGLRSAKLLERGMVAYGTLTDKQPTNTRINDQTVYELTFKFTAESTGREHLAKARTHEPEVLEDEEEEPLLYLPSFPDFAVLFDNLPGTPSVDPRGRLQGGSMLSALLYLATPALGILETMYAFYAVAGSF